MTRSSPARPHSSPPEGDSAALLPLPTETRWLWSVCYRMTGSSTDADDLVQDTLLRAMERPPARRDEPLEPWLLRVAVNLARDTLRRRKRRAYVGPWLPGAVDMDQLAPLEIPGEGGTEGRYDLLESVSFAFLLALEVLTPNQRAVLVLRDVLDRSVQETAELLGLSEANVKVIHHRARSALAPYDARRAETRPTSALTAAAEGALQRFLAALAAGDQGALLDVLSADVEAWSDGGGVFHAARVVVSGPERVALLYANLAKKTPPVERFALRPMNATMGFVAERTPGQATHAPRFVLVCDVDAAGRIRRLYSLLAPLKLTHVAPLTP